MSVNNASQFRKVINAEQYWVGKHKLQASDVVNSSTVTGTTVEDALDYISSSGVGPVLNLNGLTAATQTMQTGTAAGAGNDFNITTTGLSTHVFNMPSASATVRGVVTTGVQTFAGAKTFSGIVTLSSAPVLSTGTVTVGGSAVTIPSGVETLVGRATTDTLTNKTLEDSTTSIVDAGATSRVAKFECSSISNSTTRTFTFPDANVVLVGDTNTQTLTNKTLTTATITDAASSVSARALWYGSGANTISTYASGTPSSGMVLTATGATTATWQTPSTGGGLGTSISDTTFDQSGVALTASVTTTPALWTSGTLVADGVYTILWGCKAAGSVAAITYQYLHSADTLVARYSTNGYGGTQGILSNAGPAQLNVYDVATTTTRHPGFFTHIYVQTAGTLNVKLVKTADTVTISASYVKIWRMV